MASLKRTLAKPSDESTVPSSSPAFATPSQPPNPVAKTSAPPQPPAPKPASVLPIIIPPKTLRPLAVRTFTKKHNLTISTSALTTLAAFIGKHCGAGWKNEGLAEGVLEEVAKMWKKQYSEPIVSGDGEQLKGILKTIEPSMVGGRVTNSKSGLSRQNSFAFSLTNSQESGSRRPSLKLTDSFGVSRLEISGDMDEDDVLKDPREWIKVINAFDQPRMNFNTTAKNFEKSKSKPTLFPAPSVKTHLFRQRYQITHQRILRTSQFAPSPFPTNIPHSGVQPTKLTPIANLLGRHSTNHILLGLLTVLPTGTLALTDPTGSIALSTSHARAFPSPSATWFTPGMIVLVDGVYLEHTSDAGGGISSSHDASSGLAGTGGVGGMIGGVFLASVIGHPPPERRSTTLGIADKQNSETQDPDPAAVIGPAFGWTDFLGVGSERGTGTRMRKLMARIIGEPGRFLGDSIGDGGGYEEGNAGRRTIAIASECTLDHPPTLTSLRHLFSHLASRPLHELPLALVLIGNFSTQPALSGVSGSGSTSGTVAGSGGLAYKAGWDALAAVLADFPVVTAHVTLVFVPGERDAWAGSVGGGGAVVLPEGKVPSSFTGRVGRVVGEGNREVHGRGKEGGKDGEVIWATNPVRMSWFGVVGELVVLRDDLVGRMRRNAINFREQNEDGGAEGGADVVETPISTQEAALKELEQIEPMEIDMPDAHPSSPPAQFQPPQTAASSSAPSIPKLDADTLSARRLIKTILDQAHLAPFPMHVRPVHWDYAGSLSLYPLPSALVLADADAPPFATKYMGCCVMNPGQVSVGRRGERARWVEFDVGEGKGEVREVGGI